MSGVPRMKELESSLSKIAEQIEQLEKLWII